MVWRFVFCLPQCMTIRFDKHPYPGSWLPHVSRSWQGGLPHPASSFRTYQPSFGAITGVMIIGIMILYHCVMLFD